MKISIPLKVNISVALFNETLCMMTAKQCDEIEIRDLGRISVLELVADS